MPPRTQPDVAGLNGRDLRPPQRRRSTPDCDAPAALRSLANARGHLIGPVRGSSITLSDERRPRCVTMRVYPNASCVPLRIAVY